MARDNEFVISINYSNVWRSEHYAYELHPDIIKWLYDNIGPFEDFDINDLSLIQKPNTWRYCMPTHYNENDSHFNPHWDDVDFIFGDKDSALKFKLRFG